MTTLDMKADCNMQRINALLYFARFFLVFKKTRLDCIKKKKHYPFKKKIHISVIRYF